MINLPLASVCYKEGWAWVPELKVEHDPTHFETWRTKLRKWLFYFQLVARSGEWEECQDDPNGQDLDCLLLLLPKMIWTVFSRCFRVRSGPPSLATAGLSRFGLPSLAPAEDDLDCLLALLLNTIWTAFSCYLWIQSGLRSLDALWPFGLESWFQSTIMHTIEFQWEVPWNILKLVRPTCNGGRGC